MPNKYSNNNQKRKKSLKNEEDVSHSLIFSKDRINLFRKLPVNRQGFVLLSLSRYVQAKILNKLKTEEIIKFLHYLDLKESADILRNVKQKIRIKIISQMNKEIKEKIEFLLRFNPRTAAGLMNLDYIEVDKNSNFGEVAKAVREYEKKTKKFPEILVVENGIFIGELDGYHLFSRRSNEKISKYIKKVPAVKYDKNEKEIIELFRKNPKSQIVVLDDDKSILGVIYSAEILNIIGRESGRELSVFAGVKQEEDVHDSVLAKVKNRYKWLIINLGTAFLAAGVVSLFEGTISRYVLLAVYMPIIAGMGGNAATQTLAVMVRGIALGEISFKNAKKVILREAGAGALNGIINGALVAVVAWLFNNNPLLGLVVAIAMVINLVIAGVSGTIIPLIMKRLGKDPASSATIFITTATDVCGFFAFLGLASLIL